jgi:predicted O-linked N-acetylglucosamine transferase (SPINDLY family)
MDQVFELSLSNQHAKEQIERLRLDVLVFADVLSEPMAHYLLHSRLASVQLAFWGNPVTSGGTQIDYFVSSDQMEHPFRSRMAARDEPYTEQVLLLDGQGIWYDVPKQPKEMLEEAGWALALASFDETTGLQRPDFGLSGDNFVFLCPQSVFKMHPLFDEVLLRILLATGPNVVVVVTGGRRQRWTTKYQRRMVRALGRVVSMEQRKKSSSQQHHHYSSLSTEELQQQVASRLVMVPRVSAERFPSFLKISNVLLHPFPFDGSRTSADGLHAGLPVLTLPAEQLRGRMASAFYRTMDVAEMVAHNVTEYVSIAARLAVDTDFYSYVQALIRSRVHLIWEDMEVPFQWARLLARLGGAPSLQWHDFLGSKQVRLCLYID